jgi:hypothetical protein
VGCHFDDNCRSWNPKPFICITALALRLYRLLCLERSILGFGDLVEAAKDGGVRGLRVRSKKSVVKELEKNVHKDKVVMLMKKRGSQHKHEAREILQIVNIWRLG